MIDGCVESPVFIVTLAGAVQPAASVMVTVIVPGPAFVKSNVVAVVAVEAPVVSESTLKV